MTVKTRRRVVEWEDPQRGALLARQMSGIELFRKVQTGEVPAPPISLLIGQTIEEVEEGRIVMALHPDEHLYNPIGTVHGGVIATILDSVMGCAVHTMLPKGRGYTTLEIKVNYLRAALVESGQLRAEGKAIHVGRRSAVAEGRLTDAQGRLVATASTTCLVFDI